MTKDAGMVGDIAPERAGAASSPLAPDVDASAAAQPGPHGEPAPDITRTEAIVAAPEARSISLVVLAVLAMLYTLYFGREFFVPIAFAVLLNFLLSPLIRLLARVKIAPPAGAALVVIILMGAVGGGVYSLAGPAQTFAASAPATLAKAGKKLRKVILAPVQKATSQVEKAASTLGDSPSDRAPQQVVVNSTPTIGSRILGTTQVLVAAILEIAILLYFLLAGGDLFLQKFIKVLPSWGDKRKAVNIARQTEAAVSAYLSTALFVNMGEGVVVALLLWALDMPSPALWGAMVFAVEFIPYLGALAAVVLLGLAGLTTFDNVGHALLIPGSFLAVNLIQANLVTPMLLGHRLTLNPVAIFIGLTFFFWIWGVAGAFLAVPLLATLKIFCDHITSLAALGEFLGERDDGERRVTVRAMGDKTIVSRDAAGAHGRLIGVAGTGRVRFMQTQPGDSPHERPMYPHLHEALTHSGRPMGRTRAGVPGHDVQFYRTDEYLTAAVVEFLAEGAKVGQPLIIIATAAHRRAFENGLRMRGLDAEALFSGREALWLDARETLASFMVGAMPDPQLFEATVGNVFQKILRKRSYLVVRGYGEMVDLLWKDGNSEGALRLEALWNDLGTKYAFSLLCGYAVDNFFHAAGGADLRCVCDYHTHTGELEDYPVKRTA